jgi:23S rRNA (guanosine2251-2'-O)-methyltransferase
MMEKHDSGVIYGIHAVEEAVRSRPTGIERIYFDQDRHTDSLFALLKECRRLRIAYQVVPGARIEELAPRANHQGVAAQCPVRPYDSWEAVLEKALAGSTPPLFLIPASVEDPRNLGAIVRTAAGFGISALLLEQKSTAPLSSIVAKTAAGGLEHVAICRPRNLEAIVKGLRDQGFAIVGAEAGAERLPSAIDFTGPSIVVLGGENRGIPPYLKKLCTAFAGIPIAEAVSSLNVSVAAGILLYEAAKQRNR